ncbi:MAG: glycoside hydrolase family 15 protein [Chthoniobacterales bacterium]
MSVPTPKIQDYALIGNGRSAALVSRYGAIEWLCWPRFDNASIFAAMLDRERGGAWMIAPSEPAEIERQYIENTNVLETRFRTPSGEIVLTDFMAVTSEENKRHILWPEHEIIRRVKCEGGEVPVRVYINPRPEYGRETGAFQNEGHLGWRMEVGRNVLTLRSEVKLSPDLNGGLFADLKLRAGQTIAFSLTFATEAPATIPPLGDAIDERLQLTIDWWRSWAAQAKYDGPYRREAIRSALVLKLLSYAPSGAIIAAPTTSLPETIGADLNWDYRFAWLRDASYTVRALYGLGYEDDAAAFVSWLLHATRLTRPELRVLYDIYGERPCEERVLDHLRGYADSRPVRVGNAARDQLQLDVYGEVVDAVTHFIREGERVDRDMQQMLRQFGRYVCEHWREPDNGMWEYRDERRSYTHSRLLCWVAVDRLLKLNARGQLTGIDVAGCEQARAAIRQDIEKNGWNEELDSYTEFLGGSTVDANLFVLALQNFEPADSERMRRTYRRIREKLVRKPGLVLRNERSIEWREGAFALCSFWEIDFLARGGGTLEEAHAAFKSTMSYANDLGLFAEELDPQTGDALGNFPQGFTHLGVINAALSLHDREERERKLSR